MYSDETMDTLYNFVKRAIQQANKDAIIEANVWG